MRIEVLGTIQLRTETGEIVPVPERKVRLLLAALVSEDGKSVSADALIDRVWGDRLPLVTTFGENVVIARIIELRAAILAGSGRPESAAVLWGVAEAVRETATVPPSAPEVADLQWIDEQVTARLSAEDSSRARDQGRRYARSAGITRSNLGALNFDGITLKRTGPAQSAAQLAQP
ncbi:DNA-binding winged helix-turn-helix (wHTH) protein [Stackebrandtia endophytica]|uniref:DNA-binding winged helix-turn-helix (WHTH) protein n=1 Tax=Stackebrandtia endophytica TaxID=1496996 RepID=A0A543AVN0_9ACTN|nr:helix-turn-helix domain-containing protein [Stackebrandtia endophytica]TQL76643.1 DNA-binding winged helix-turn-helix (wHTH) protein [Stackebrandtia endophytica]